MSFLIPAAWLLAGCVPERLTGYVTRPDLTAWCDRPPLAADPSLAVFGPGGGHDPAKILTASRKVLRVAGIWLGLSPGRFRILVFSALDPEGQYWIARSGSRHRAAGKYFPDQRLVWVAGDGEDSRFWEILGHETVHALVDTGLPPDARLPLWFMEGTAALFEYVTESGYPLVNRERLALMRYRLARNPDYLKIRKLIRKGAFTGDDYAQAWAVAAFLHQGHYPVAAYVQAVASGHKPADELFAGYFLEPGQSLISFSKTISLWLLSQEGGPIPCHPVRVTERNP